VVRPAEHALVRGGHAMTERPHQRRPEPTSTVGTHTTERELGGLRWAEFAAFVERERWEGESVFDAVERLWLTRLIREDQLPQQRAADVLSVSARVMNHKCAKYGLRPKDTRRPRLAKAIACTLWLVASLARATTYYVDQGHGSASDSNAGTNPALPWLTLQRATSPLGTEVVAGDTVYVKAGTYAEPLGINACDSGGITPAFFPVNSGTASAPIAFRRFPGHTVTVDSTCPQRLGQVTTGGTTTFSGDSPGYTLTTNQFAGLTIRNRTDGDPGSSATVTSNTASSGGIATFVTTAPSGGGCTVVCDWAVGDWYSFYPAGENNPAIGNGSSFATGTVTTQGTTTFTDSTKSFTTNALVGYGIRNTSDGSTGTISANTATTITATLTLGAENDWDAAEAYVIGRNYITWDGFTLAAGSDVRIEDCIGCIVERMTINKGEDPDSPGGGGNYDGIRVQVSESVILRNNTISNVRTVDQRGSGVKFFDVRSTRVHNNNISACDNGIDDKEAGFGNTYDLNYIHGNELAGVNFTAFTTASRCNTTPAGSVDDWNCAVRDNVVKNNLIHNSGNAGVNVNIDTTALDSDTNRNVDAYNNTIYEASDTFAAGFAGVGYTDALVDIDVYNNIIRKSSDGSATFRDIRLVGTMPADLLSNYNAFRAITSQHAAFMINNNYATGCVGAACTLANWRLVDPPLPDANSITTDPLFVGPLSGSPPPVGDYALQAGSPCLGTGRIGGVSGGAAVNMGAYETGSEVIGLEAYNPVAPVSAFGRRKRRHR